MTVSLLLDQNPKPLKGWVLPRLRGESCWNPACRSLPALQCTALLQGSLQLAWYCASLPLPWGLQAPE